MTLKASDGIWRIGMLGGMVVLITFPLTACSQETYDYAIPDDLCGVPVGQAVLKDLLPPGKSVELEENGYEGYFFCEVMVDSPRQLDVRIGVSNVRYDPDRYHRADLIGEEKVVTKIHGDAVLSGSHVQIAFPCSLEEKREYGFVEINVRSDSPGSEERRRERLEEFAQSFVPNLKAAMECDLEP